MRPGISQATALAEAVEGLLAAMRTALAEETPAVDIGLGFIWPPVSFDWAAITDTESSIDPKNIGPDRQLAETLTMTVNLGSWNPEQSPEQRDATFKRATELLAKIQTHIRVTDITLGGVVLWCVPGGARTTVATPEERSEFGEFAEIEATFVALHRISTTY